MAHQNSCPELLPRVNPLHFGIVTCVSDRDGYGHRFTVQASPAGLGPAPRAPPGGESARQTLSLSQLLMGGMMTVMINKCHNHVVFACGTNSCGFFLILPFIEVSDLNGLV